MSLDARLRQGMIAVAEGLDVEIDLALVQVRALGRRRERRNVTFAALAGAAAAILLLLAGPRLADQLLSMEVPVPPARDQEMDRGIDKPEERVYDEEDVRRANRRGRNRKPVITGFAAKPDTGTAPGAEPAEAVPAQPGGEASEKEPPPDDPIQRTASAQYSAAHASIARSGTASCADANQPCFEFPAQEGERYVSVSITDAGGGPVLAWIQQDVDGDGASDGAWKKICDATTSPVQISAGAVVRVMLDSGTCSDGRATAPTQGTVTVTFSDGPR